MVLRQTWKFHRTSNAQHSAKISLVILDPTQSGVVFVGGNNKVYKSTDEGTSFTNYPVATSNYPKNYVADIAFLPSNPDVMMISTQKVFHLDGGHAKIFVSSDAGETWTEVPVTHPSAPGKHPGFITIATTPLDNAFYIHFGIDASPVVYPVYRMGYSNSSFGNWSTVIADAQSNVNYFTNEFEVSPTNKDIFYFGKIQFHRKDIGSPTTVGDLSLKWTKHDDLRDIQVFSNGVNDIIYVANDGGVSISTDNGNNWYSKNGEGPYITQFHEIGLTSEKQNYIVGGAQDNNTFYYDGQQWGNDLQGDGLQGLVSWDDPNIVYVSQNGDFDKRNSSLVNNISNIFNWDNIGSKFKYFRVRQAPELPNRIYAAKEQQFSIFDGSSSTLDISVDGGANRIPLSPTTFKWEFLDIQVAPSDNNILYASDLEINYCTNELYASAYGRGVFPMQKKLLKCTVLKVFQELVE